jgi:hypothetical protein
MQGVDMQVHDYVSMFYSSRIFISGIQGEGVEVLSPRWAKDL